MKGSRFVQTNKHPYTRIHTIESLFRLNQPVNLLQLLPLNQRIFTYSPLAAAQKPIQMPVMMHVTTAEGTDSPSAETTSRWRQRADR
jgi:hypothetical protein